MNAIIPAGITTATVRVPVMSDNIVEGDEMFSMSLTVPSSLGLGIVAGSITSATGIIVDSTSKGPVKVTVCINYIYYRHKSKVHTHSIHWFRRCRICIGNIGTS